MREAGDRTTWTAPDEAYESAVHAAVDAAFDSDGVRRVLDDLLADIDEAGAVQRARREAGRARRCPACRTSTRAASCGSSRWSTPTTGGRSTSTTAPPCSAGEAGDDAAAKLHVRARALTLRRDRPDLFTTYAPVPASGPAADHVLAFDRGGAITVATRLPWASPRAAAGATRRSSCRTGVGATR